MTRSFGWRLSLCTGRVAICLIVLASVAVTQAADQITLGFNMSTGQPIADVLASPESWVYLGTEYIPNKMQTMTWVKPIGVPPREVHDKSDQGVVAKAVGLIGKPRERFSGEYSESFEYQSFPRPRGDPKHYFDAFRQQQLQVCPSSKLTLIRVSDTELLFEAQSEGCEHFGEQDEIDRFLFGKRSAFHV